MKKLNIVLAPIVFLMMAMPAAAEKLSLNALSDYFNGMKTAGTNFTQTNEDGSTATGRLLIRRPGGMRFEYSPPNASLVMAGGGQIAVFDQKSNQPPERFPLNRTPLELILARNVDLQGEKMVVAHTSDGETTTVTAQDPANPEYGQIQLIFSSEPTVLRQWIVTDGTGEKTTVVLGDLQQGIPLRAIQFNIQKEMRDRGF